MCAKKRFVGSLVVVVALATSGCSSSSSGGSSSVGGNSNGGGTSEVAGANAAGTSSTGGAPSNGGTTNAAVATGGQNATGGNSTGIGATAGGSSSTDTSAKTGGRNATGGVNATGGNVTTGGRSNTAPASGGSKAVGGSASSGGAVTTGGTVAVAGSTAAGGTSNNGGSKATGGAITGTGGSTGPAQVRWIGRVDSSNPVAVKFAWTGTGFVASVEGTKISVKLQSNSSAAYFQPVIDGTAGQRFQVNTGTAQTYTLGSNLSAGTHQVELYRETEGMYGDSVFLGFVDGTVVGAPAAPGRLIEVVGDSISAGYGNTGTFPCSWSLQTESAYQAYGHQLGRLLKADVSVLAASGWGMVRSNTGSTSNVLPAVYANAVGTQSTPAWNFAQKPDAVIINLGTNDSSSSDPGKSYEEAYVTFLKTVRGHYPNAWIFLTIGPMTSGTLLTAMRTHLTNVITTFADAKVTQVNIEPEDAANRGCDYHPNVAEDTIMANVLKTALAAKLGW